MKKLLVAAFAAGMILISGVGTVQAATVTCSHPYCFDENGDGICDYHDGDCEFIDKNGDGICDNYKKNCKSQKKSCKSHRVYKKHHHGRCHR